MSFNPLYLGVSPFASLVSLLLGAFPVHELTEIQGTQSPPMEATPSSTTAAKNTDLFKLVPFRLSDAGAAGPIQVDGYSVWQHKISYFTTSSSPQGREQSVWTLDCDSTDAKPKLMGRFGAEDWTREGRGLLRTATGPRGVIAFREDRMFKIIEADSKTEWIGPAVGFVSCADGNVGYFGEVGTYPKVAAVFAGPAGKSTKCLGVGDSAPGLPPNVTIGSLQGYVASSSGMILGGYLQGPGAANEWRSWFISPKGEARLLPLDQFHMPIALLGDGTLITSGEGRQLCSLSVGSSEPKLTPTKLTERCSSYLSPGGERPRSEAATDKKIQTHECGAKALGLPCARKLNSRAWEFLSKLPGSTLATSQGVMRKVRTADWIPVSYWDKVPTMFLVNVTFEKVLYEADELTELLALIPDFEKIADSYADPAKSASESSVDTKAANSKAIFESELIGDMICIDGSEAPGVWTFRADHTLVMPGIGPDSGATVTWSLDGEKLSTKLSYPGVGDYPFQAGPIRRCKEGLCWDTPQGSCCFKPKSK